MEERLQQLGWREIERFTTMITFVPFLYREFEP
jgi:hypothetical protein